MMPEGQPPHGTLAESSDEHIAKYSARAFVCYFMRRYYFTAAVLCRARAHGQQARCRH